MTEPLIKTENLTKYYGTFPALLGASFEVAEGEIVGLLGPNGSGKTTLMQILTSVMLPTRGQAWVGGHNVVRDSLNARKMIGYCSEKSPLYLDMSVKKYLRFTGSMKGVKEKNGRISRLLGECGLDSVSGRTIGKLSKGYRQRVSLAQALINDPEVLILDEPTVGLDPEQVRETRALIKQFARKRATLISTHILYEAGILCDRLIIMNKGKVLAVDTPEHLESSLGGFHTINLQVEASEAQVENVLEGIPEIIQVIHIEQENSELCAFEIKTAEPERVTKTIANSARNNDWGIHQLAKEERTLEDLFHDILERAQ